MHDPAEPVSKELAQGALQILLLMQSLLNYQDFSAIDALPLTSMTALLNSYPKAYEHWRQYLKQDSFKSDEFPLKEHHASIWDLHKMENEIENFCLSMKHAYFDLQLKLLEFLYGKQVVSVLKNKSYANFRPISEKPLQIPSIVQENASAVQENAPTTNTISNSNNPILEPEPPTALASVSQTVPPVAVEKGSEHVAPTEAPAKMSMKEAIALLDPEGNPVPDPVVTTQNSNGDEKLKTKHKKSKSGTKKAMEEEEIYSTKELWLDELIFKAVPMRNCFQELLEPSSKQKWKMAFGNFPFKDNAFKIVVNQLQNTPSVNSCNYVFDLIKLLLNQKYQEVPTQNLAEMEGLEEILNNPFHVINIQKILYVHILIRENLARRQRDRLEELLKMQYRRSSLISRFTLKAYQFLITEYKNPIKHSMRETQRLDELLQFMFRASRADENVEDVELPPSLKRLPI